MAVGLKCDAQMQALARERRPYFESTNAQANDPKVSDAILEKFAIRVDEGGNIVENDTVHAADSLIKAFIGYCVQVMPNVDRIEVSAKPLGWKEIDTTAAAAALLAPPSRTAKWKAWLVEKGADVPFALAISQDTVKGESFAVCAVANLWVPAAPVRAALTKMLCLGQPVQTQIEGGQQYTYWTTKFKGEEITISFIDATPMEETGVNTGVTSPVR